MSGIELIPIRWPDKWDPAFMDRIFREVLALADTRNAVGGTGITVTGTPGEVATISGSVDVQALLDASLVVATDSSLDNQRILTAGPGISITDGGPDGALLLEVDEVPIGRLGNMQGQSVLGAPNAGSPFSPVEEIVSTANDTFLRRVADVLEWGQLTAGMFPDSICDVLSSTEIGLATALFDLDGDVDISGVLDVNGRTILDSGDANPLRLIAPGATGDLYLSYYEPDETTRKAYIGYPFSGNDIFTITNIENAAVRIYTNNVQRASFHSDEIDLTANLLDLNGSVDVSGGILSTVTGLAASNAALMARAATPYVAWFETDAAANNALWTFGPNGEEFLGMLWNDAFSTNAVWLRVNRTLNTIDEVELNAVLFDFNGDADISGSLEWGGGVTIASSDDVAIVILDTFTGTLTGMTATTQGTISYSRSGNNVRLWSNTLTGTSNATSMTMTGIPAAIQPAFAQTVLAGPFIDNGSGAIYWGLGVISGGTITFELFNVSGTRIVENGTWTNVGTKGLGASWSMCYDLLA